MGMGRRFAIAFSGIVLVALLVAVPALAGAPGNWTRVTGFANIEALNTDEVGLERSADGVLHVAWTRSAGGLSDALLHSAIAANAKSVSGPDTIVAGGNDGLNPRVDLVATPTGGLRVLFAGLFPETSVDRVMSSATAPASGTSWSGPEPVSSTTAGTTSPVYVGAGIGGALSPAGQTVFAWGDSGPGDGGYHVGLAATDADLRFSAPSSAVDSNVAFDVSGAGYVAWDDLAGAGSANSLSVMPLAGGGRIVAPNSAAVWIGQRVSISGRIGAGGVYVAYGSGGNQFSARPAWWPVGAAKAMVVKGQGGAEHTGMAPAPAGRLWLYWERNGKLYAARTNKAAKKLGAIVALKPPKGTSVVYRMQGEGSRGPLDLLALADAKGGLGYFHQRVLPGLSLLAKPKTAKAGKAVAFKVSDAGEPVKGAKVVLKLGKKKLAKKTNAKGKAVLKIPAKTKPGKYKATARRGGYAKAVAKLRVKR